MNGSDVDKIISAIMEEYHVTKDALVGKTRVRNVVEARHMCCYFLRFHRNGSLYEIGRIFNRNHSVIVYACTNIENLLSYDNSVRVKFDNIKKRICNQD